MDLLTSVYDTNPYLRDIYFPSGAEYSCGSDGAALTEVSIVIGDVCYKRVHPDHMSVHDFTYCKYLCLISSMLSGEISLFYSVLDP